MVEEIHSLQFFHQCFVIGGIRAVSIAPRPAGAESEVAVLMNQVALFINDVKTPLEVCDLLDAQAGGQPFLVDASRFFFFPEDKSGAGKFMDQGDRFNGKGLVFVNDPAFVPFERVEDELEIWR